MAIHYNLKSASNMLLRNTSNYKAICLNNNFFSQRKQLNGNKVIKKTYFGEMASNHINSRIMYSLLIIL